MFMASKFHDVVPVHSIIVAKQIGHGLVSSKEIIAEEERYLKLFGFDINYATHFDFLEIFMEKIRFKMDKFFKFQNQYDECKTHVKGLLAPMREMSILLIKMSLQSLNFCSYSPSIVTISSIFASTAFVKHSKTLKNDHINIFCKLVRKIVFEVLSEELEEQKNAMQK